MFQGVYDVWCTASACIACPVVERAVVAQASVNVVVVVVVKQQLSAAIFADILAACSCLADSYLGTQSCYRSP